MLEVSWKARLHDELNLPYMQKTLADVHAERQAGVTIYPPEELVFEAFLRTPFSQVKAVILGQDPYHNPGQAHGLSFSVPKGVALPPSLVNIFKELRADLKSPAPLHGCLEEWAAQGVLLLNTILTVRKNEPFSHHHLGWERFTDRVILELASSNKPMVFILWGKAAQKKCAHILAYPEKHQLVLKAPHPSPFSAHTGFFGSFPFSKTNDFLKLHGIEPIDWTRCLNP